MLVVPTDLADRESATLLVAAVTERFGRLDVFVSNAAKYAPQEFTDLSPQEWDGFRATNIDAFVFLTQTALPELERTGGSVVAVGSVSGLRGDWSQAAYNATKAAVMNLVQSIALDWGARGVRLNSVAPAFALTDVTSPAPTPPTSPVRRSRSTARPRHLLRALPAGNTLLVTGG